MNIDIKLDRLREVLREELQKIIEEQKKVGKPNFPPLSIPQLADRYGVSKATVHNWMKKELIIGFKMGKGRFFHLEEVEKNLKQFRYLDLLESKGLIEKRNRMIP